jgi:hypothetical protein
MRNALGDIGNKLIATTVNLNGAQLLKAKQSSQDGNDLIKKQIISKQQQQQQNQPILAPPPPPPRAVTTKMPGVAVHSPSNNSCSMIEIESSDDDEDVDREEEYSGTDEESLIELDEDEVSIDDDDDDGEQEESAVEVDSNEKNQHDEDEMLHLIEFPKDVIDIDEEDTDNTQLVAEYVKDIYYYLHALEKRFRVSPTFLNQKTVTAKMRSILIDWLIQVHIKFHLLNETLYLCVQVIDAYLEVRCFCKLP